MSDFIPYSRQSIDKDDVGAVLDVLTSDFLTQGPKVEEFEKALASYCGARHAVAFSSGTAALHAAYFSAGIGKGDEIITSPITFAATSNAALYLGARPVFADVEAATGNIDPKRIEPLVTERTKAIVPVHYAGCPVDMRSIEELAKRHSLLVIEDASHALGASYGGRKIGSISDMTIFSFHPVKPITTGEGGAVLTNNESLYKKLLVFRTHGITRENFVDEAHGDWYYEMQHLGFNYRLTDIQSALGLSQLKKLDRFVKRRNEITVAYHDAFKGNGWFDLPAAGEGMESSWHLYPVRLKDALLGKKAGIFAELRQRGLGVQIHYIPVYLHPYYRGLGFERGLCPVAEDFYARELSLPLYQDMGEHEVAKVVDIVSTVFRNHEV